MGCAPPISKPRFVRTRLDTGWRREYWKSNPAHPGLTRNKFLGKQVAIWNSSVGEQNSQVCIFLDVENSIFKHPQESWKPCVVSFSWSCENPRDPSIVFCLIGIPMKGHTVMYNTYQKPIRKFGMITSRNQAPRVRGMAHLEDLLWLKRLRNIQSFLVI